MANDVTLKELMEDKFQRLDKQLLEIKQALNHLSQNMVHKDRFESKMHSVKELRAQVAQQDERIDDVEHFQSVLKYVGGVLVSIGVALVIAKLSGLI